MDRIKIASELVRLAKSLVGVQEKTSGMFDTVTRIYDNVDKGQLAKIKQLARRYRGRVKAKDAGFGSIAVSVTFKDNFPESFAVRDAENFDDAVKSLRLEKFTGMPSMLGL